MPKLEIYRGILYNDLLFFFYLILTTHSNNSCRLPTINITPEEACEKIRLGAKEGILNRTNCNIKLPESITMEICFKEHNKAKYAGFFPNMIQTGPYTVSYTGKTVREVAIARMFTL